MGRFNSCLGRQGKCRMTLLDFLNSTAKLSIRICWFFWNFGWKTGFFRQLVHGLAEWSLLMLSTRISFHGNEHNSRTFNFGALLRLFRLWRLGEETPDDGNDDTGWRAGFATWSQPVLMPSLSRTDASCRWPSERDLSWCRLKDTNCFHQLATAL